MAARTPAGRMPRNFATAGRRRSGEECRALKAGPPVPAGAGAAGRRGAMTKERPVSARSVSRRAPDMWITPPIRVRSEAYGASTATRHSAS